MDLALTNVINVSVSETQAGIGKYNTSNIAFLSGETAAESFGTDGYKLYLSPDEVATDFGTGSTTYAMALSLFSQQPNILTGNGYLAIILMEVGETMDQALARTSSLVQYFGVIATEVLVQADMLAAAAVLQTMSKIGFFVSKTAADLDVGGMLDLLRSGNFSHSRGLFYGSSSEKLAMCMAAAYAGRALSTNFSGSNTTQTMHLKDLKTVQPDPMLTQTLLAKAQAAGVDVYASLQGVPKVLCSGANTFFDRVYNQLWFVGEIKVAGFNFLAQSSTKVPQTEGGMDGLRKAYRNVAEQSVVNQYVAPGEWTSATTFGNQSDFLDNIRQRGYYIYSAPIAQQSVVDRAARKAPLVQIALKEAGAVHESSVIININQ